MQSYEKDRLLTHSPENLLLCCHPLFPLGRTKRDASCIQKPKSPPSVLSHSGQSHHDLHSIKIGRAIGCKPQTLHFCHSLHDMLSNLGLNGKPFFMNMINNFADINNKVIHNLVNVVPQWTLDEQKNHIIKAGYLHANNLKLYSMESILHDVPFEFLDMIPRFFHLCTYHAINKLPESFGCSPILSCNKDVNVSRTTPHRANLLLLLVPLQCR